MANFIQIEPTAWSGNPIQRIGTQWLLICAKQGDRVNLMTASWGGVGMIWNVPAATVYIRPQRFTRPMVDEGAEFSLLFFDETYRPQLNLCGSKSGRDVDKIEACGFTLQMEGEIPYVAEASDVLLCRKLYQQDLEAGCFVDPAAVDHFYPERDIHRMYIAEIQKLLVRA